MNLLIPNFEQAQIERIKPSKPLYRYGTTNNFIAEFVVELDRFQPNIRLESLNFLIQTQEQPVQAGQLFTYADLPAIKMIKKIEIALGTAENIIETLYTPAILERILAKFGSDSKWPEFRDKFLGGVTRPLSYSTLLSEVWLLPIVSEWLLPLDISEIMLNSPSSSSLIIKIYLRPVLEYSISSSTLKNDLLNYTSKDGIISDCSLVALTRTRTTGEPVMERWALGTHTVNKTRYFGPRIDPLLLPEKLVIEKIAPFIYNPYIAKPSHFLFYSPYTFNAVCTYFNSFIHPANKIFSASDVYVNLRTGQIFNNTSGQYTFSILNTETYLIGHSSLPATLKFTNATADWNALSEDVFFDMGAFVEEQRFLQLDQLDTVFFYMRLKAVERTTPTNIQDGPYQGLVEGLFYTSDNIWAIYGFQSFKLYDFITGFDFNRLLIAMAQPVRIRTTTSIFSNSKFVYIADPLYIYLDLDRTMKFGLIDIRSSSTNNKTRKQIDNKLEWMQLYVYKLIEQTRKDGIAFSSFMPPVSFSFGPERFAGSLDTFNNQIELDFNIGIYKTSSHEQAADQLLDYVRREYFGALQFDTDFIHICIRKITQEASSGLVITPINPQLDILPTAKSDFSMPVHESLDACLLLRSKNNKRARF